jgi:hypothetical protein
VIRPRRIRKIVKPERETPSARSIRDEQQALPAPRAFLAPAFRRIESLALSYGGGSVSWTEMEPTEAEKLKARRVQLLLYALIVLMIGLPLVIFVLKSR